MKKIKRIFLIVFIALAIVFLINHSIYKVIDDFKTKDLLSTINLFIYILIYPVLYLSILFYDIDGKSLRRSKILHYIMLALSVSIFVYSTFYDIWGGVFALYFAFAVLGNLIIISIIKNTVLKQYKISLKKEWLTLIVWITIVAIFFLIPKR